MPLKRTNRRINDECSFLNGYIKVLKKNKIPFSLTRYQNTVGFWNEISKTKYFVARWKGNDKDLSLMHAILPEIEKKGVLTLPSFNNVYHCGDKLRLATFYKANNINTPNTYIFFSIDEFREWFSKNEHKLPLVGKLRQGSGSKNVIKIATKEQANRLAHKLFKYGIRDGFMEEAVRGRIGSIIKYGKDVGTNNAGEIKSKLNLLLFQKLKHRDSTCMILQEYLPNNNYDTRVTVIGERAFCFRRHNRKNDFRASGSSVVDYEPKAIDERMIEMAFSISKKYSFKTMGYDFLYDQNNQPSLIEMNYTYGEKILGCPIYWKPCGSTNKHLGRIPQYWQLVDLLDDITLKYF